MLDFSSQYGNDDSISYTAHNIVGRSAIAIFTFSFFTRPFSADLMFQHAGQASSPPMATSPKPSSCATTAPGGEIVPPDGFGADHYLVHNPPHLVEPTSLTPSLSTLSTLLGYMSTKPTTLGGWLVSGQATVGVLGAGSILATQRIVKEKTSPGYGEVKERASPTSHASSAPRSNRRTSPHDRSDSSSTRLASPTTPRSTPSASSAPSTPSPRRPRWQPCYRQDLCLRSLVASSRVVSMCSRRPRRTSWRPALTS